MYSVFCFSNFITPDLEKNKSDKIICDLYYYNIPELNARIFAWEDI